jgi:hypothetical protein
MSLGARMESPYAKKKLDRRRPSASVMAVDAA